MYRLLKKKERERTRIIVQTCPGCLINGEREREREREREKERTMNDFLKRNFRERDK